MQRNPSSDDYLQAFSRINALPGCELIVAEEDGEVIGTTMLMIVPNLSHKALPWAVVENVVVDSDYRRKGIGRLLMDYCEAQAKKAGCYKLQLLSNKSRNEAHQFYLHMAIKHPPRDSDSTFNRQLPAFGNSIIPLRQIVPEEHSYQYYQRQRHQQPDYCEFDSQEGCFKYCHRYPADCGSADVGENYAKPGSLIVQGVSNRRGNIQATHCGAGKQHCPQVPFDS